MSTNQIQQAVIYIRAKRTVTAKEDAVVMQEQACRDWCTRNGWPVSEPVFVEYTGHPYTELFDRLQPGDVLVSSRPPRDARVYWEIVKCCADRGVPWQIDGAVWSWDQHKLNLAVAEDCQ